MALNTTLAVGARAEHTDNALKESTNGVSDIEQVVDADVGLSHQTTSLSADINYSAAHSEFDKNTQDSSTSVVGDASIKYEQIPQALIWSLDNSRRSMVRDLAATNIQANRQDNSITRAASKFNLTPSAADTVSMEAFVSDITYEDTSNQDSERAGGNVSWGRAISLVDRASLNLTYEDVTFDQGQQDYEYYNYDVGYAASLARLNYNIRVGYNEQKRDADNNYGGKVDTLFSYSDAGSTWSLALLQELTDTSRANNNSSLSGLNQFGNSNGQTDVFERTNIELSYQNNWLCGTCNFTAAVFSEEETYQVLDDDNKEIAARTGLSYAYSSRTSFNVGGQYRDITFNGLNPRSNYTIASYDVGMSRQMARSLSMSLFVMLEEKDSDNMLEDYDELRGGLSLKYQLYP